MTWQRHHKADARPHVIGCGGTSLKTGKTVGERHRWDGGAWGKGRCEFCGRTLDQVLSKPEPNERTLEEIIHDAK